jgi:hypothetical protein
VGTVAPKGPDDASRPGPWPEDEPIAVDLIFVNRKHWDRLKEEVREAKMGWAEVWLGASFAFLGIAATAAIALLELPTPGGRPPGSFQFSSPLRVYLTIGASASATLALVCFLSWLSRRHVHNTNLDAWPETWKAMSARIDGAELLPARRFRACAKSCLS